MSTRVTSASGPRWHLVVGFWVLFWVILTAIRLLFTYRIAPPGRFPSPVYGALNDAIQLGQWALLTPAIFWLARRLAITRANWRRRVPVHLAIGIVVVLATSLVMMAVHWLALPPNARHPWTLLVVSEMMLAYGTPIYLLLYAGILGTGIALSHYAELQAQRLASAVTSRQLADAQLHALRMQLHPHFLFNTLNTIANLTEADPPGARRVIAHLGNLLRRALASAHEREVELAEELRFVDSYLEIARARFGDRLRAEVHVEPEARRALVPPLLLQPLVENALEHGIAAVAGPGLLAIDVGRDAGRDCDVLRVRVRNSGRGLRGDRARGGVGLANTRARLGALYGDAAGLEVREVADEQVLAEAWLPFHTAADASAVSTQDTERLAG